MIKTCVPHLPLAGRGEIILGAAEDLLPHYKGASFDLIFSSPPYFDREKYRSENVCAAPPSCRKGRNNSWRCRRLASTLQGRLIRSHLLQSSLFRSRKIRCRA